MTVEKKIRLLLVGVNNGLDTLGHVPSAVTLHKHHVLLLARLILVTGALSVISLSRPLPTRLARVLLYLPWGDLAHHEFLVVLHLVCLMLRT